MTLLERFIVDTNGKTDLIFTISPSYEGIDSIEVQPLINLCRKYNIPLVDKSRESGFIANASLFKDEAHLNRQGAVIYSSEVGGIMKNILKKDCQEIDINIHNYGKN